MAIMMVCEAAVGFGRSGMVGEDDRARRWVKEERLRRDGVKEVER